MKEKQTAAVSTSYETPKESTKVRTALFLDGADNRMNQKVNLIVAHFVVLLYFIDFLRGCLLEEVQ